VQSGGSRGKNGHVHPISEKDYTARAFPELSALVEALDEHPDGLFAELGGDVLTIEFDDKARYIVNSHLAARQIWLAADRSAWHFDYDDERGAWLDKKSGAELWSQLESLLQKKLGRSIKLRRKS
jgi:CyaY protein